MLDTKLTGVKTLARFAAAKAAAFKMVGCSVAKLWSGLTFNERNLLFWCLIFLFGHDLGQLYSFLIGKRGVQEESRWRNQETRERTTEAMMAVVKV